MVGVWLTESLEYSITQSSSQKKFHINFDFNTCYFLCLITSCYVLKSLLIFQLGFSRTCYFFVFNVMSEFLRSLSWVLLFSISFFMSFGGNTVFWCCCCLCSCYCCPYCCLYSCCLPYLSLVKYCFHLWYRIDFDPDFHKCVVCLCYMIQC